MNRSIIFLTFSNSGYAKCLFLFVERSCHDSTFNFSVQFLYHCHMVEIIRVYVKRFEDFLSTVAFRSVVHLNLVGKPLGFQHALQIKYSQSEPTYQHKNPIRILGTRTWLAPSAGKKTCGFGFNPDWLRMWCEFFFCLDKPNTTLNEAIANYFQHSVNWKPHPLMINNVKSTKTTRSDRPEEWLGVKIVSFEFVAIKWRTFVKGYNFYLLHR